MSVVEYKGVSFTLADRADLPCWFVLGVRKSGSTIFSNMIKALAESQEFGIVDMGRMFEVGVPVRDWRADPGMASLLHGGNLYAGFREFPEGLKTSPGFIAAPKVLLVRDPRDALVSEYFSNAYSHPVPEEGPARERMLKMRQDAQSASVENLVLERARAMRRTMLEYVPLLSDPLLKLYRYEDVIFAKRALMESVAAHFRWSVDPKVYGLILEWADVLPSEERPTEFIRQVRPGDHRNKLSPEGIEKLTEFLAEPLEKFGYKP
jgi:hypothetical protein